MMIARLGMSAIGARECGERSPWRANSRGARGERHRSSVCHGRNSRKGLPGGGLSANAREVL